MELNSIIDNNDISLKIQDIYKYIDKNEDKFNEIFNRLYEDIKNLYKNVSKDNKTIEIKNIQINDVISERTKCHNILIYHSKLILEDKAYLYSYAFKINIINSNIMISKKR